MAILGSCIRNDTGKSRRISGRISHKCMSKSALFWNEFESATRFLRFLSQRSKSGDFERQMAKISASAGNIRIIVKDQHNNELFFNMKRDIPLRKLLAAYCNRTKVDYRTVTLVLNGDRVRPDQTPEELKMENDDEIDVMTFMMGGGCYL